MKQPAALLLLFAATAVAQTEGWDRAYALPPDSFAARSLRLFAAGSDIEAEAIDLRLRLVRLGGDKGPIVAPDGGTGNALLRFGSRRDARIVTARVVYSGDDATTELFLSSDPESAVRTFDGRWDFLPDEAGETTLAMQRMGDRSYELLVVNADGSLRAVEDVAGIQAMHVTELVLSDRGGHAAVVAGAGTRVYRLEEGEAGGLLYNLPQALWVDLSADGSYAALVHPNAVHVYRGAARQHVISTAANVRGTAFAESWLALIDEATLHVVELVSGSVTTHALPPSLRGAEVTSVDIRQTSDGSPVAAVGVRSGTGAGAQSSVLLYEKASLASAPRQWRWFSTPDYEARSPQVRFTADGARVVAYARLEARVSENL